jgi:uncharacterized protein
MTVASRHGRFSVNILVLDAHAHCGLTVPYHELAAEWEAAGIGGGVILSPVEEIYDRHNQKFTDSEEYRKSRRRVHKYVLEIASREHLLPYYFVWNDFSPVPEGFLGIKWHRHPGEPPYRYDSPQCERAIEEICSRQLPVILEEEFANTLDFIRKIGERTVIILPHMGGLNGGYPRLKDIGVFENHKVWLDTALGRINEIADFAASYGSDRLLFGSDYPFGSPVHEKDKLSQIFSGSDLRAIFSRNLLRLLGPAAEEIVSGDAHSEA